MTFTGAIPQHPVPTTDQSFSTLGLSAEIIRTIDAIGFVHPTPIQAAVIPTALQGKDVIGLAQTGSGTLRQDRRVRPADGREARARRGRARPDPLAHA
jgi:hypothetical protein